jgi:Ca2+-binding RTX toxin-like protein
LVADHGQMGLARMAVAGCGSLFLIFMLAVPSPATAFSKVELSSLNMIYRDVGSHQNHVVAWSDENTHTTYVRDPGVKIRVRPNSRDDCVASVGHARCQNQLTPWAEIQGRDGRDSLVARGPAILEGGRGDDELVGGKYMYGDQGGDEYRGGVAPFAVVDYLGSRQQEDRGIDVTLDNRANDGFPGEHDDVHRSVDAVNGTVQDDSLAGAGGVDYLFGLAGNDHIAGKVGDDHLLGGHRNDTLGGGRGEDLLNAGQGNDLIHAQDGETDEVMCGDGTDRAIVDAIDVVSDCEHVVTAPSAGER